MEHQFDAPPELRLIVRKFARVSQAPASRPELSLQALNTTKLQDGAVAMVYSADGASTGLTGFRQYFAFDRAYTGPTSNGATIFTPVAGGGVWRLISAYSLLDIGHAQGPDAPVTLTAGGGATLIYSTFVDAGLGGKGLVGIDISLILTPAVAGSVVALALEGGAAPAAAPAYGTTLDTKTVTMAVGEQMVVTLFGALPVPYAQIPNQNVAHYRVRGTATVQNASVPATGLTDRWTIGFQAGGG